MLPDSNTDPTGVGQSLIGVVVSGTIGCDLVGPESGVRRCRRVVLGAAVPEAPVQEDRDPGRREDHVGRPPQASQRPAGDPVAEPERVHR